MKTIKNLWRNPWGRLFVVAWALLLVFGFVFPDESGKPIHSSYGGQLVNWWYFVVPPALALAVRLVVSGFSSKYVVQEPQSKPPVAAGARDTSDARGVLITHPPRRVLKWTVAAVLLIVWSAFVFGLGIDMQEKQMVAARFRPGSLSYKFGSTGYSFGWDDGFKRGYAVGAARAQAGAKAGGKVSLNDYAAIVDHENPPEWGGALAAHEAGLLVVRGSTASQEAAFAKPPR
jgi:hypothetical protein